MRKHLGTLNNLQQLLIQQKYNFIWCLENFKTNFYHFPHKFALYFTFISTIVGIDTEEGICNEDPCVRWTEWGPWSSCSVTCGSGTKQRYRKCKNLDTNEIYNVNSRYGLAFTQCKGLSKEEGECSLGKCVTSDCGKIPLKFYSFSGRPATSIADCSWDFFGCTKRIGKWPSNKKCCKQRFDACCMVVMGKQPMMITTTSTTTVTTTTTTPPTQISISTSPPHAFIKPEDKIELSKCFYFF